MVTKRPFKMVYITTRGFLTRNEPHVAHNGLRNSLRSLEFASVTRASCGNPGLHIDFGEE